MELCSVWCFISKVSIFFRCDLDLKKYVWESEAW